MTDEVRNTLQYLEEVGAKKTLTSSDKSTIATLYEKVLLKKFIRTGCSDCYRDAAIEAACYIRKHGGFKQPSKYLLKCGALVDVGGFGALQYHNRDTMTDDVARKYIRENGEGVLRYFERYPDNWREDCAESPENVEDGQSTDNGDDNAADGESARRARRKVSRRQ